MHTHQEKVIAGLAVGGLLFGLSACSSGSGSVEAFCSTVVQHKTVFLDSMTAASVSQGLAAVLDASTSELKSMWSDLAAVAPPEVEADTKAMRDAWIEQDADSSGALVSSLEDTAPMTRVYGFVKANCSGDFSFESASGAVETEQTITSGSASPKPESKFPGTVNYAAFENFDSKDELDQDAACGEFYDANLPNSIRMTPASTGPEVARWYADHVDVLSQLNLDKSDPRNQQAAIAIASCITAVHGESATSARTYLLQGLGTQASGSVGEYSLPYIDPAKVTRYSDGVFVANGSVGGVYNAFSLEGNDTTSLGEQLLQQVFEWHSSEAFPSMRLTAEVSEVEDFASGGKAPIVVDPAYEGRPWH